MSQKGTFYITTPIYYPSRKLYIGNLYTAIIYDAMACYKCLMGFDVFYLTGVDGHGQKVEEKAVELNVTLKEYVGKMVADVQKLWKILNISYDKLIRTTDNRHMAAA